MVFQFNLEEALIEGHVDIVKSLICSGRIPLHCEDENGIILHTDIRHT
jgi:hypothetical protein